MHCTISDAIKTYAREKIEKFEKYFDGAKRTDIMIHAEEGANKVELVCTAKGSKVFTVNVLTEQSVREAIDLAAEKMGRQLRRHKERLRGHKGKDKREKLVRDIKRITRKLGDVSQIDDTTYEDALKDALDNYDKH